MFISLRISSTTKRSVSSLLLSSLHTFLLSPHSKSFHFFSFYYRLLAGNINNVIKKLKDFKSPFSIVFYLPTISFFKTIVYYQYRNREFFFLCSFLPVNCRNLFNILNLSMEDVYPISILQES